MNTIPRQRRLVMWAIAAALAGGLLAPAPTRADVLASNAAPIAIVILPYAEVILSQTTVNVTFADGETSFGPVDIGGTVICNCPVSVFADIAPPDGAPGQWTATAQVARIEAAGIYEISSIIRIAVQAIPSGSGPGDYTLFLSGGQAASQSQIPTPAAGEVFVTVVPD